MSELEISWALMLLTNCAWAGAFSWARMRGRSRVKTQRWADDLRHLDVVSFVETPHAEKIRMLHCGQVHNFYRPTGYKYWRYATGRPVEGWENGLIDDAVALHRSEQFLAEKEARS